MLNRIRFSLLKIPRLSNIRVSRLAGNNTEQENDDQIKKPVMPEPVQCCGSGCNNCVWLTYAEDLLKYYGDNYYKSNKGIESALKEIEKLEDENLKVFLQTELKLKKK